MISKNLLPHLFRSVAKAPELVLVSALAWCFFLAAVASLIGLSREMGALIAGISLSTFPYSLDVIAKVASIRDFFVTLFFVGLGMQIPVPSLQVVAVAVAASAFLVVSRFTVVPILSLCKLGLRASLLPAINLANISEFSIVIASLGLARGQVPPQILTIVIITFALTSVTSTYMINANHVLQDVMTSGLKRIGLRDLDTILETGGEDGSAHDLVFLGFFRDASSVLHELERNGRRSSGLMETVKVIDFNPRVIQELRHRGVACQYGDISHPDTLRHAGLETAKVVASTIPDEVLRGTTNLRLLRTVRRLNPSARVVVTSEHIHQARDLYEEGADFVYLPRLHSARELAEALQIGLQGGFDQLRTAELEGLLARNEVLS